VAVADPDPALVAALAARRDRLVAPPREGVAIPPVSTPARLRGAGAAPSLWTALAAGRAW